MAGRKPTSEATRDRGERLSSALRRHRRRAGLSAQELGQRAGVSPEAIRRIEQGRTFDPGFFTVADLADILGVGINDLAKASSKRRRTRRT
jgi:transcriptional regulator with XRE-family HTH domain